MKKIEVQLRVAAIQAWQKQNKKRCGICDKSEVHLLMANGGMQKSMKPWEMLVCPGDWLALLAGFATGVKWMPLPKGQSPGKQDLLFGSRGPGLSHLSALSETQWQSCLFLDQNQWRETLSTGQHGINIRGKTAGGWPGGRQDSLWTKPSEQVEEMFVPSSNPRNEAVYVNVAWV